MRVIVNELIDLKWEGTDVLVDECDSGAHCAEDVRECEKVFECKVIIKESGVTVEVDFCKRSSDADEVHVDRTLTVSVHVVDCSRVRTDDTVTNKKIRMA